jgi:hypothetical protein
LKSGSVASLRSPSVSHLVTKLLCFPSKAAISLPRIR